MNTATALPDLMCFSHLRWDFVYQRPQHLMSRFSEHRTVTFIEEPVIETGATPHLRLTPRSDNLSVAVPVLPEGMDSAGAIARQRELIADFVDRTVGAAPTVWFETPMALPIAPVSLDSVVIYDCMDELSGFHGAPTALAFTEKLLLTRADLVFTGGRALYESRRKLHPQVHCFPSGVDVTHFGRARALRKKRTMRGTAADDRRTAGFAGVIDERMDVELLDAVAAAQPEWDFEIVGPVVKIDADSLPHRSNIRYTGMRTYAELPAVMAKWDVGILPFAHNSATRFISPTKTPEYLAAGLPAVSTAVTDVVADWGAGGHVLIADSPADFARALNRAYDTAMDATRIALADRQLADRSWESIVHGMTELERGVLEPRQETDAVARDAR